MAIDHLKRTHKTIHNYCHSCVVRKFYGDKILQSSLINNFWRHLDSGQIIVGSPAFCSAFRNWASAYRSEHKEIWNDISCFIEQFLIGSYAQEGAFVYWMSWIWTCCLVARSACVPACTWSRKLKKSTTRCDRNSFEFALSKQNKIFQNATTRASSTFASKANKRRTQPGKIY